MAFISCPSCGEKGSVPNELAGKKVRCQKCGASFQAVPVTAEFPLMTEGGSAIGARGSRAGSIDVDGLDPATWAASAPTPTAFAEPKNLPEPDHEADGPSAATQQPAGAPEPAKAPLASEVPRRQYKVLTQRDGYFEGKFDLARLEAALNHYAGEGWVVRSMATPHIAGFSGGPREEIVVLLER